MHILPIYVYQESLNIHETCIPYKYSVYVHMPPFFFTIATLYIKQSTYKSVLQRRLNYKEVHKPDQHNYNNSGNEDEFVTGRLLSCCRRLHLDGGTTLSVS
jgi:hypothetical protein